MHIIYCIIDTFKHLTVNFENTGLNKIAFFTLVFCKSSCHFYKLTK